ncbi:hypothetical protein [Luteolibacter marinus]|uniref:hypothetical protein n=1 Tax=Luteolibacter marinus TaxID=2776705 RepID=UPI001868B3AF|nr:hypothetical protein [Luteolibacter marinus]
MNVATAIIPIGMMVLLLGCERNHGNPNAETKGNENNAANLRKSLRQDDRAKVDTVWKRWRYQRDDYANLSRAQLDELINRSFDLRYTAEGKRDYEMALGELASRDPNSALAYFDPKQMRRSEPGFKFVANILAETSPGTLKIWLQDNIKEAQKEVRDSTLIAALGSLGNSDLDATLEFYSKTDWGNTARADIVDAIFLNAGANSPEKAEVFASSRLKGTELDRARYNISVRAIQRNPSASMEIALKISDPTLRETAFGHSVSALMDRDPAEAFSTFEKLSSADVQSLLASNVSNNGGTSLVKKLIAADPDKLIHLLNGMVLSDSVEPLFEETISSLSVTDPEKSLELLGSIPDGEMKHRIIKSRFKTIATENPSAAILEIVETTDRSLKLKGFEALGEITTPHNIESIATELGQIDTEEKDSFYSSAISSIARTEPKMAAELIMGSNLNLESPSSADLIASVASSVARLDLEYADAWMQRLPENRQPNAMHGIATQMAASSVTELSNRLSSMERGRAWAEGVKVLINSIKASDPDAANLWQMEINRLDL